MKTKREVLIGFFFLVVLALAGMACTQGPDATVSDAAEYCRMVWVHKHDARYGWPDFHHVYAQQCSADGTVNENYVYQR